MHRAHGRRRHILRDCVFVQCAGYVPTRAWIRSHLHTCPFRSLSSLPRSASEPVVVVGRRGSVPRHDRRKRQVVSWVRTEGRPGARFGWGATGIVGVWTRPTGLGTLGNHDRARFCRVDPRNNGCVSWFVSWMDRDILGLDRGPGDRCVLKGRATSIDLVCATSWVFLVPQRSADGSISTVGRPLRATCWRGIGRLFPPGFGQGEGSQVRTRCRWF